MKRIKLTNLKLTSKKNTQQLVKDWESAKKSLERKIANERNSEKRTKLELYHAFFLNHSVDKRQGTIKEKSLEKKSSNICCGSAEIK